MIQTVRIFFFLLREQTWASVQVGEVILLHVIIQGSTFFHLVTLLLGRTLRALDRSTRQEKMRGYGGQGVVVRARSTSVRHEFSSHFFGEKLNPRPYIIVREVSYIPKDSTNRF